MVRLTNLWRYSRQLDSFVDISKPIAEAITSNKPVVALETTIVTHGMPYPENERVALEVEEVVRQQGAVAATIGVVNGRIKVGLDSSSLSILAKPETKKMKISKRDLPYALSRGLTGGTTVAATVFVSKLVGIDVFVTGGIGGVHRDVNESMDVSADLLELSRNPVLVVSAGVKSILDIGRTLEFLETCGVSVVTFGEGAEFPAFFSRQSGFKAPYNVSSINEAARLVHTAQQLSSGSGILLAVPIPEHASLEANKMQSVIDKALAEAKRMNISGKSVTPFLLDRVRQSTAGESLASNTALIKNNAQIGSRIAVKLSELKKNASEKRIIHKSSDGPSLSPSKKVVCIGGANLDILMYPKVAAQVDCTVDGTEQIANGKIVLSTGGVARNIADAVGRLRLSKGEDPASTYFIGSLGNDDAGQLLLQSLRHVNSDHVYMLEDYSTGCYAARLEVSDSAVAGIIEDFSIHAALTPEKIYECEKVINDSSFVVFDGNLSVKTIDTIVEICHQRKVKTWFEPTEWTIVMKPFTKPTGHIVDFVSPNLRELQILTEHLTGKSCDKTINNRNLEAILTEARDCALHVLPFVPNIMVTLGKHGLLMVNEESATFYEPTEKYDVISNQVYGVGDCVVAGYIVAFLNGLPQVQCISVAMNAALQSLKSSQTVPKTLSYQLATENLPREYQLPLTVSFETKK